MFFCLLNFGSFGYLEQNCRTLRTFSTKNGFINTSKALVFQFKAGQSHLLLWRRCFSPLTAPRVVVVGRRVAVVGHLLSYLI